VIGILRSLHTPASWIHFKEWYRKLAGVQKLISETRPDRTKVTIEDQEVTRAVSIGVKVSDLG